MRLKGRRAFITGGGRGIGRAIALAFAAEGADVAVSARTRSEVERVAAEVEALGRKAAGLCCDVVSSAQVGRAFSEAESRLGGVDILVANAGRLAHAPVCEISDEAWDDMLRVNLSGVFYATRAALGGMTERGWGRVIAMSSVSGKIGGPYRSAYHAAKHGVLGFVRSVALEVADKGVTVNAICPGFVETEMISCNRGDFARFSGQGSDEEQTLRRLREEIPMRRFLEPSEIAALAVFLASDDARGITGQGYNITCGAVQT